MSKFYKKTTPKKGKKKTVEGQLFDTTKRLIDAEENIAMFSRMIKRGIATNDVFHFVENQSNCHSPTTTTTPTTKQP